MPLPGADNRGTVADAVADADPVSDMEFVELLEIEHLAKMSDVEATLQKHPAAMGTEPKAALETSLPLPVAACATRHTFWTRHSFPSATSYTGASVC